MTPSPPRREASNGALSAALCYLIWGLVPLYWHQLASVAATELIAHRLVWSLVFVAGLLFWRGGMAELRVALSSGRGLAIHLLSSLLLTGNWLVYVWGVNHGHVIECSLGYFLVPLLNVALGRWVLHEQLRPTQIVAIGCAALGVAIQVWQVGRLPWIALALAVTFGGYGLLRKRSALGPLTGLATETTLLAPAAAAFLLWREFNGGGALGHAPATTQALVLSTGVVTAIPLLLFAYGARRIRLTTLGLLQYIAPTVQFTLGVTVFHEPFARERLLAFAFIWAGLALYTWDNLRASSIGANSTPARS
jgi:chloramphenicol-sensitive protein RarD